MRPQVKGVRNTKNYSESVLHPREHSFRGRLNTTRLYWRFYLFRGIAILQHRYPYDNGHLMANSIGDESEADNTESILVFSLART